MDKCANVCRSCLTTGESFSHFIFENITPETYLFCTSIEVKRDELPKALCSCCYNLLQQFSEFKKTCIQSENKLLGYSNIQEYKIEIELKTEFEELNYDKGEVIGVAVKREKSDDKLNEDASEPGFCENIDTQNLKETVRREKSTKTRQKQPKGTKPNRRKTQFKFTCDLCDKRFVLRKRYETHKLKHERKTAPIQCKPCDKTFMTLSGLWRHNKSDHSPISFKDVTCKICSKVCKTPVTLKIHHKIHEDRKVQICDECGKEFKSVLTLKSHLETHIKNRQRTFDCEHCGKKYISTKTRAKHIYRRHRDKRFICHYCDYPFSDKSNLIKHIMIHEGKQRLYKCDVCFRVLTAQASLIAHKRIHTGEKPFLCSYCPKRFSGKGMLVDHQRIHTGEKPFQCSVCEQRFNQRRSMKRHMKVHDRLSA